MSVTLESAFEHNMDNLTIDVIQNEILTKMNIHTLMALRKVNQKYRELVSKYLGITTDSVEFLSVVFRDGKVYSIASRYAMSLGGLSFEKKFNFRWNYDNDHIHRWSCYEIFINVEQGNCIDSYVKNGATWFNHSKPQLMIEDHSFSEWLYESHIDCIGEDSDEDSDEDDRDDRDVDITYFKQGVELGRASFNYHELGNENKVKAKLVKFLNNSEKRSKLCKIAI